jgi:hypothetical protein
VLGEDKQPSRRDLQVVQPFAASFGSVLNFFNCTIGRSTVVTGRDR